MYQFAKEIVKGENEVAAIIARHNSRIIELVKRYQTGENLLSAAKAYVNYVDCFVNAKRPWPKQLGKLHVETKAKAGLCLPVKAWCVYKDEGERKRQDYTGVPIYILSEDEAEAASSLGLKPQIVSINFADRVALVGVEALMYAKIKGESLEIQPS